MQTQVDVRIEIDDIISDIKTEVLKEELEQVKILGEEIGYGQMMTLASELWKKSLKEKGYSETGAFVPKIETKQRYIRFGEIPQDELSTIHHRGEAIGKEIGTSVFYSTEINGEYHIVLQNPITEQTFNTLHGLYYAAIGCFEWKPTYVVEGDFIGLGSDGEPLIKNIKIVKEIQICSNK